MENLFPEGTMEEYKTVGVQAYHQGDFATAVEWLEAAARILQQQHNNSAASLAVSGREASAISSSSSSSSSSAAADAAFKNILSEIYDYMSYSLFRLGDLSGALDLSVKLLQMNPLNARIADNIAFYQYALTNQGTQTPAAHKSATHLQMPKMRNFSEDNLLRHDEQEMADYRALCRGEVLYTPSKPLTCNFETYGNPRLLLKPAKIEHLHWGDEDLTVGGKQLSQWEKK